MNWNLEWIDYQNQRAQCSAGVDLRLRLNTARCDTHEGLHGTEMALIWKPILYWLAWHTNRIAWHATEGGLSCVERKIWCVARRLQIRCLSIKGKLHLWIYVWIFEERIHILTISEVLELMNLILGEKIWRSFMRFMDFSQFLLSCFCSMMCS
jgi:hypothetical protein